jgi:hypothetical protein
MKRDQQLEVWNCFILYQHEIKGGRERKTVRAHCSDSWMDRKTVRAHCSDSWMDRKTVRTHYRDSWMEMAE